MILLAPHLRAFLTDRLMKEQGVSEHTRDAYAYTFTLLLDYISKHLRKKPSDLPIEAVDAPIVTNFLVYLEVERGNSPRSRNARLAAIRSFARFLEYRVPTCIEQVRRLKSIPMKKTGEKLVDYLTREEIQAVLDSPNPRTADGLRDRAMLHLAFAAGLRVSELVGLRIEDITLQGTPTVRILGKGRRERLLPLWKETATALRAWMAHRGQQLHHELFLSARLEPLTRAGFAYVLKKHTSIACKKIPSLVNKKVSPHTLRHTCAMNTLQATGDIRKVALWLGHASIQSTEIYVRTNPMEKLDAIKGLVPPKLRSGRFLAPDRLLASLRPVPRYAKPEAGTHG